MAISMPPIFDFEFLIRGIAAISAGVFSSSRAFEILVLQIALFRKEENARGIRAAFARPKSVCFRRTPVFFCRYSRWANACRWFRFRQEGLRVPTFSRLRYVVRKKNGLKWS